MCLETTRQEEPVKPGYRDPLFAIAFVVHVIVIAIVAFSTGIPALRQASELYVEGHALFCVSARNARLSHDA